MSRKVFVGVAHAESGALACPARSLVKYVILDKLIRYTGRIKSLDNIIQASIKLNNKFYKRAIEKQKRGYILYRQSRKGSFDKIVYSESIDIDNPVYNILRILSSAGKNRKA